MPVRYWPLGAGRVVTSPFGPRDGGFHSGTDFGRAGGSAGMTVYAVQAGTVIFAGAADGYGGPDPAGWLVIDSTDAEGGGCLEYGHIVRRPEIRVGVHVEAGQPIAVINPNRATNANVAPHLHLSDMPGGYAPNAKQDPMRRLTGAREPENTAPTTEVSTMGDPTWLPDVLRAAGLKCDIYPGAFDRGHGDFGEIWGVVCHHTGSFGETPRGIAEHPSLGLASQLYLARDGRYTLCGVGVAWHAGAGAYPGLPANNANFRTIGIEGANDGGGTPGKPHHQPWSDDQYNAYVIGVGAILKHLGQPASHSIDHKEWAGAAQGKWDRGGIDPNLFRNDVAAWAGGTLPAPPAPVLVPGVPVEYANFGVIRRGDKGVRVVSLQTRLKRNYSKIVIDGDFGPDTEAKVRDYQRLHPPLVVDGQVGPATAAMLKLVG